MDNWCPFWKECYNGNICENALTDEVKANIKDEELEIYKTKPYCFEEKDNSIINNSNNG